MIKILKSKNLWLILVPALAVYTGFKINAFLKLPVVLAEYVAYDPRIHDQVVQFDFKDEPHVYIRLGETASMDFSKEEIRIGRYLSDLDNAKKLWDAKRNPYTLEAVSENRFTIKASFWGRGSELGKALAGEVNILVLMDKGGTLSVVGSSRLLRSDREDIYPISQEGKYR